MEYRRNLLYDYTFDIYSIVRIDKSIMKEQTVYLLASDNDI